MNLRTSNRIAIFAIAAIFSCGLVNAQKVTTQISSREAFVGMPIVLQIKISNTSDYELPDLPEIDGCDVKTAGTPSQSSQITIINGRRSESRSVTMQYLITPRRAGTYEIPSLTVLVDGQKHKTGSFEFLATKSETGDLLFVDIEGNKDKVYVGEPLDMKLKIWIKPFQDRERKIKLTEGQMWQLVADQTSWGAFADRITEMSGNNQRPGGNEVLRDNGEGNQRSYYLYEIDATIYPTRPGKIDDSDVQVVVRYPTALGKSRDPFESMFGDRAIGGSARLKQMLDNDFFGSPFGSRLTVSSARPVVAEATVDATEVVSVPMEGRPDDYRGAVGRYRIVSEAEPKAVNAGDPITLRIGVVGDGPMELVQAPPLSDLEAVTDRFKVSDQALAGFVQEKTKVFVTTIRPRREGVSLIPPIPFSFFDPENEAFETVYSEPIAIEVNASETLSFDSIVSNLAMGRKSNSQDNGTETGTTGSHLMPNLTNDFSNGSLVAQSRSSRSGWWWYCVIVPPMFWLVIVSWKILKRLSSRLPSFRSAKSICISAIGRAEGEDEISQALIDYISSKTAIAVESKAQAVGALRAAGLYSIGNKIESQFDQFSRKQIADRDEEPTRLEVQKESVRELLSELETAISSSRKLNVRSYRDRTKRTSDANLGAGRGNIAGLLLLLLTPIVCSADDTVFGADGQDNFSRAQLEEVFGEANELYENAQKIAARDQAEASELFSGAAEKYQLLADAGIKNSRLLLNLGNAYLQRGELGHAIANYRRSLRLDPNNKQATTNLLFVEIRSQLLAKNSESDDEAVEYSFDSLSSVWGKILLLATSVKQRITQWVGVSKMKVILAIASILFWGLLIVRALGASIPVIRITMVPLLILLISGTCVAIEHSESQKPIGILTLDSANILSGDGDEFDVIHEIESGDGRDFEIVAQRGSWIKVKVNDHVAGWLPEESVERID